MNKFWFGVGCAAAAANDAAINVAFIFF